MAIDPDEFIALETRRLCARIQGYVEDETWGAAADHAGELVRLLTGHEALTRYSVRVSVASRDRPWFHEVVEIDASSRILAVVAAETRTRLTHQLPEDATVRTVICGVGT